MPHDTGAQGTRAARHRGTRTGAHVPPDTGTRGQEHTSCMTASEPGTSFGFNKNVQYLTEVMVLVW